MTDRFNALSALVTSSGHLARRRWRIFICLPARRCHRQVVQPEVARRLARQHPATVKALMKRKDQPATRTAPAASSAVCRATRILHRLVAAG
jgi:hypothetical protein